MGAFPELILHHPLEQEMRKLLEAARTSQAVQETFLVGSGLTLQVHLTAKSEGCWAPPQLLSRFQGMYF